jgi:hypothetical protein
MLTIVKAAFLWAPPSLLIDDGARDSVSENTLDIGGSDGQR